MSRYDFIETEEFDFFGVENACRLEPCENGGTCVFAPGLEPPYGREIRPRHVVNFDPPNLENFQIWD